MRRACWRQASTRPCSRLEAWCRRPGSTSASVSWSSASISSFASGTTTLSNTSSTPCARHADSEQTGPYYSDLFHLHLLKRKTDLEDEASVLP